MEILICPVCSGNLDLAIEEETPDEVVEGFLLCGICESKFQIHHRIANLLAPVNKGHQASPNARSSQRSPK